MNDKMVTYLALLMGLIFFFIVILFGALIIIKIKEKKEEEKRKRETDEAKLVNKSKTIYTPESILDFMEFEKIEDNMIIQKNRKVFNGC